MATERSGCKSHSHRGAACLTTQTRPRVFDVSRAERRLFGGRERLRRTSHRRPRLNCSWNAQVMRYGEFTDRDVSILVTVQNRGRRSRSGRAAIESPHSKTSVASAAEWQGHTVKRTGETE